jgi:mono/diheme cytochrome c family protein
MKRIVLFVACAVMLVLPMGAAESKTAKPQAAEPAPEPVMERGAVRAIRLPEAKFELPPGKGRETVVGQCAVCHTLAYIPLQPPLSREQWTTSVTKMQKTFSAPIPDDKIAEIVDYLVAVNGKK